MMIESAALVGLTKIGMTVGTMGTTAYLKRSERKDARDEIRSCPALQVLIRDKSDVRHLEKCLAQRPSAKRRSPGPKMIEFEAVPTAIAVGTLVGSLVLGAGLIAFVEAQGEKTVERGGLSDETKSRMAGMFMEDEVLVTDLDDTISKMEAALAKAEGRDVVEGDGLTAKEREDLTDDWGAD